MRALSNRKVVVSISFIWSFITLFLSSAINYNTDKSWYYIVNPFENMLWFLKYIIPNLGSIGIGLVFLVILPSFFIILSLMLTSSNLKFFLFGIVLLLCYVVAQIYSLCVGNLSDFFSIEHYIQVGILISLTLEIYLIFIPIYKITYFYKKNK